MQLQTGEVLKHLETEAEAVYKAAIPTLGHGLIHLLVGAEGYLLKFTSELEQDFSVPSSELPVVTVNDPLAGITAQDVQALLSMVRAQGGVLAGAQQAPTEVAAPVEDGLDKAPAAAAPEGLLAPADAPAAPAAPAAGSGAIPL